MPQRKPDLSWLTARPISHRGLHDWRKGVVENTLGAFTAAINGNYAIECDLQVTRDGEAVLFHDNTLDRVTEASGEVQDRTVTDLKKVKFRHGPEAIPALKEMLDLVAGKVPLVIELKPQWNGDDTLVRRTLSVLKSYAGPHGLMSFDPDAIAAVKSLSPGTIRGIISDRGFDPYYNRLPPALRQELRTLACVQRIRPHFLSIDIDELPWAPVTALRSLGMPVITWTVRSPQQSAIALRYCDQVTFENYLA